MTNEKTRRAGFWQSRMVSTNRVMKIAGTLVSVGSIADNQHFHVGPAYRAGVKSGQPEKPNSHHLAGGVYNLVSKTDSNFLRIVAPVGWASSSSSGVLVGDRSSRPLTLPGGTIEPGNGNLWVPMSYLAASNLGREAVVKILQGAEQQFVENNKFDSVVEGIRKDQRDPGAKSSLWFGLETIHHQAAGGALPEAIEGLANSVTVGGVVNAYRRLNAKQEKLAASLKSAAMGQDQRRKYQDRLDFMTTEIATLRGEIKQVTKNQEDYLHSAETREITSSVAEGERQVNSYATDSSHPEPQRSSSTQAQTQASSISQGAAAGSSE